jgi:hypothetical protein
LRTLTVTRYVTPLREGGSLPAIVEADDDGMYVLKFRGAGQGPKVLVAELIAGEIGRALGLRVPEIVFAELDAEYARTEPDEEIQHLIRASGGLNLGLDYLPGSVTFDPVVDGIDGELASSIVWFDAFTSNVDRTPRNTNMLIWHRHLWLIDHGASLYFHHGEDRFLHRSGDPFTRIKDHVLLAEADALEEIDERMTDQITPDVVEEIVASVPEEWLGRDGVDPDRPPAADQRRQYAAYLLERLKLPHRFVEEAVRARAAL